MKYIFAFILCLLSIPAQAEVYRWIDPVYKIKLTYPHDWMYQAVDRQEGLRLHIVAPQAQDQAACRIYANEDGRFLYVPPRGAVDVAQFVQDEEALRGLLANELHYRDVRLAGYRDLASLGKGPATMAIARYRKPAEHGGAEMQSIVFGGYMHGLETFFQCESTVEGWDEWQPVFLNMATNFDFPVRMAAFKNGYYRDFMADGYVYFPVGNHKGVARY